MTSRDVLCWYVWNILSKDDSKTNRRQVPVDMAMEEPWTRVISIESDGDIATRLSYAHDVAEDRID